jgi:hypothetical protein
METEKPDAQPEREIGKTEEQGGESQKGPAAPLPVAESPHSEAKVQDANKGRDETDREKDKAFNKLADAEEQQTKWERMQGEWTRNQAVATAALGLLTFLLLFHQTCTLSKQLEAMQSSSKDTQEMIRAMQKQADATRDTAERQRDIVEQMERQANASVDAANAATKQANASQTQANVSVAQAETAKQAASAAQVSARATEQSVQVAEQAMITGNRAYLSFEETGINDFVADQPNTPYIVWSNDGNSSAEISGLIQFGLHPTTAPICNFNDGNSAPFPRLVISPHKQRRQRFRIAGLSATQIKDVENLRQYFVMCGRANYVTLGKSYTFDFCSYYHPGFKTFLTCESGK